MLLLFTLVMVPGCEDPLGDDIDLDTLVSDLEHPTGNLESGDVQRLAYTVMATADLVGMFNLAGGRIPGLRQSAQLSPLDASLCTEGSFSAASIDLACLGGTGHLSFEAHDEYPNDNGDYDLELDNAGGPTALTLDGKVKLRVRGIADPEVDDIELLSLRLTLAKAPPGFTGLDETGLLVRNDAVANGIRGLRRLDHDGSYAFGNLGRESSTITYTVRDTKNLWTCSSEFAEHTLVQGDCRTPVDEGDWGILRF